MPPEPKEEITRVISAPEEPPPLVKTRVLMPGKALYCLIHAKRHPCSICLQDNSSSRERHERELLQRFDSTLVQVAKPAVALTPSELAERAVVAQGYDVDKYRKEINLGLKHARVLLRGYATSWRDSEDLKQDVDIEIWKATLHYKDRMTPELAYTIAKNQAGKFLKRQRDEQTVSITTADGPVLDEF
jgi:hypothetical protein